MCSFVLTIVLVPVPSQPYLHVIGEMGRDESTV